MTENISRHTIDQPLFPQHDGLSFGFNMINHIAYEKYDDPVFNEICKAVSKCYKSKIPISSRLLKGFCIYPIPRNHMLYEYLDTEAQKSANFVVFVRINNNILVTWFGPFVDGKHLGDIVGRLSRSHEIMKDIAMAVIDGHDEHPGKVKLEIGKKELLEKYWKQVKDILAKMEAKKIELKGFAYQVFDKPTADKLTKQLTASTGKVLVKGVAAVLLAEIAEEIGRKIAAMLAAKTAAKAATKGGSSTISRYAAKSVPVLGLAVGIGFGVWRYCQGDVTGAGLEVMSGAAACLPGGGTATSLAIDAGLIARDVYGARSVGEKGIEELKEEMRGLDKGLKDLYDNYDQAMTEYEFVKEILEVGFTVRNFEHELKILEDVMSVLDSVHDDYVFM